MCSVLVITMDEREMSNCKNPLITICERFHTLLSLFFLNNFSPTLCDSIGFPYSKGFFFLNRLMW